MTIRWLTNADRQDIRDAAEERRVLDALIRKYRLREITAEERAEQITHPRWEGLSGLRIDPYRRS